MLVTSQLNVFFSSHVPERCDVTIYAYSFLTRIKILRFFSQSFRHNTILTCFSHNVMMCMQCCSQRSFHLSEIHSKDGLSKGNMHRYLAHF